jgi:hypothetical protein
MTIWGIEHPSNLWHSASSYCATEVSKYNVCVIRQKLELRISEMSVDETARILL